MADEHIPDEKKENGKKKNKKNKFRKFNENEINKKIDEKLSCQVSNKTTSMPAWTLQSDVLDKSQYLKDFPELKSRTSKGGKGGSENLSRSNETNDLPQIIHKKNFHTSKDEAGIPAASTSSGTSAADLNQTVVASKNELKNDTKQGPIPDKPVVAPYRNPYKKKRTDPTFFSLEDALGLNARKNKLGVKSRGIKRKFQRNFLKDRLSGNILDASNPTRNKGKHREIKRKRLSNLKSLIIKERIVKQICRDKSALLTAADLSTLLQSLDFKTEVQKYVKDRIQSKKVKGSSAKDTMADNPLETLQTELSRPEIKKETRESTRKIELFVSSTLNARKPETVPTGASIKCLTGDKTPFSSKMREYCENLVTPELNAAVRELVKGLINLQDRAFSRDPIKARSKKRHVEGIKEVKKYLTIKRVKLVVIPPDLEKLFMEGSVWDLINELKTLAGTQDVPCVYAMNRYSLGRCAKKSVPVSAFAVLNYDGLEDRYEEVMNKWEKAKRGLEEKLSRKEPEPDAKVTSKLLCALRENWPFQEDGDNAEREEWDQVEESITKQQQKVGEKCREVKSEEEKQEGDDVSNVIAFKLASVVITPRKNQTKILPDKERGQEDKDFDSQSPDSKGGQKIS